MSGYADHEVIGILDEFPDAELIEEPVSARELLAGVREFLDGR